jgi:hypothetical protein
MVVTAVNVRALSDGLLDLGSAALPKSLKERLGGKLGTK